MSQASEWAEHFQQAEHARPAPYLAPKSDDLTRQVYATVTDGGSVRLAIGTGSGILAEDIFLELCRWGLATFGELAP